MECLKDKPQENKRKFQLYDHTWLSLLALMAALVFSIGLSGTVIFGLMNLPDCSPAFQFTQGMLYHILMIFILVPFVLHLPWGERTYRQYLDDIGLSRTQPFIQLVLLAFSCYIILALSQVTASSVCRFFEGSPIDGSFVSGLFYGYAFIKTCSLLPSMIVHYLGNVFIGSLTGYMQSRTSVEIQVLYGVIFSLSIVPTTLMILRTRSFVSGRLPGCQFPGFSERELRQW